MQRLAAAGSGEALPAVAATWVGDVDGLDAVRDALAGAKLVGTLGCGGEKERQEQPHCLPIGWWRPKLSVQRKPLSLSLRGVIVRRRAKQECSGRSSRSSSSMKRP